MKNLKTIITLGTPYGSEFLGTTDFEEDYSLTPEYFSDIKEAFKSVEKRYNIYCYRYIESDNFAHFFVY